MADTLGSESPASLGETSTTRVLTRVFDAELPMSAVGVYAVDGVDRVMLHRGERHRAVRRGRDLVIEVADPRMSTEHAQLDWRAHHWELRDLASKNGVRVEGAPITTARVELGDVFVCGRTSFAMTEVPSSLVGDAEGRELEPAPLVSMTPSLVATYALLDRAAAADVSIVITGETGTGKELVARAVHDRSGRRGAFVAINCGAIAQNLVEATLFGHVRGAFSGATSDQPGALRAAAGGTLVLDELADLPAQAQVALLRAVQEREVVPVGSARAVPVELRLVVTTQRPLGELVAAGTLRADLAHRLAGVVLDVPPVRERRLDLGIAIASIIRAMPEAARPTRFAPDAVRAMFDHDWPGNLRELAKCIEIAAVHAGGEAIERRHLGLPEDDEVPDDTERARHAELVAALTAHRGNISAVARALGKDRVQIRRWLARFKLDATRFR